MKKNIRKISRRDALKFMAVGVIAFLTGCRSAGKSSTTASPIMETIQPRPSSPPEIQAPSASSTMIVTPEISQATLTPQARPDNQSTLTGSKVLLVYFSRAGENYHYGKRINLEVGNTEVLAGMISQRIGCTIYRIEPVDPYPDDYEETVMRNVREKETDVQPAIANPLDSIGPYDIVLLGSPIWNVRAPMIMATFVESFDFTSKTVFPFTTHAMSGLGTTVRDYTAACHGATIGEGLAVRGEEVRDAGEAVETWLKRTGLLR